MTFLICFPESFRVIQFPIELYGPGLRAIYFFSIVTWQHESLVMKRLARRELKRVVGRVSATWDLVL